MKALHRRQIKRAVERLPKGAAASLFREAAYSGSDQALTIALGERALADAPQGDTWQEVAVREQIEVWLHSIRSGYRSKRVRALIFDPVPQPLIDAIDEISIDD